MATFIDSVNKALLAVDAARERSGQFGNELSTKGRVLPGIALDTSSSSRVLGLDAAR